ncbi:Vomp family autotransporter, partial [Bartonella tribocorum]
EIEEVRSVAVLYDEEVEPKGVTPLLRSARKVNKNSVTFGDPSTGTVGLHNVGQGKVVENSADAINGSQLFETNKTVASYLGGGTSFKDGTFTGPSYKLSSVDAKGDVVEKTYGDIGSAFEGVDTNFKNVNDNVTNKFNELNQSITNITQEVKGDALLWDKTKGAFVAEHGEEGNKTKSKITSLSNGDISASSSDAVAGNQLHALGSNVAKTLGGNASYENGKWNAPSFIIKQISEDGTSEDKTYQDVSTAFTGVGNSFTNVVKNFDDKLTKTTEEINNNITNITQELQGDALLWSKSDGAFIAKHGEEGKEKTASKIKYLAQGDISATSTEAINGSQLHSLGNNVAQSLGGGAKYEEGKWTAPSFTFKTIKEDGSEAEEKYENVSDAFAGVGSSFTNIKNEITNQINHLQSDDSAVVHYDKDDKNGTVNYGNITFGGKDKVATALHNVADGKISENSHDAINGGQINTISQDVAKFLGGSSTFNNGAFTSPTYQLSDVSTEGNVTDKSFTDVGAAFEGLDTNIKNVNNRIKEVSEGVAKDSLNWSDDKGAFVAQHGEEKTNSKITSLADGNIATGSSDAVTGSQLYSMNNTLATYLGGGTKYENGQWTVPSFKVNTVSEDGSKVEEKSYGSVSEAFESVGTSFSNLHKELKNEINQVVGDSLVKQDEETKVIKIGAEKEGTEVTVSNSHGDTRSITGVKAATVSETSTEAVNGSQLYSLNQTLASYLGGGAKYEEGQWSAPSFKIVSFKEDGSSEETSYDNVAAAFAGVNNSFTKLHHELSDNIEQNALLWSDEDKAFVALHGKGEERSKSKLSHLVDGDISEGSTEAITGNQLYQLHQTLAMYLGGGASYADGQWHAPEFHVAQFGVDGSSGDKAVYHDVASAFDGVSDSMTSMNDRIKEVSNNLDTNVLTWSEEQGAYDASHKGVPSKITNVSDGKVGEGSQEVVNGGQLWTTNEKVKKVEQKVDTINQRVKDIEVAVTDGAVNYDKDDDGKKTNSITLVGGDDSAPVLIDNVGDGKIEKGSHQAVNGGQLHDYTAEQMKLVLDDAKKYTDDQVSSLVNNGVNEAKSYTDMKFETLSYAVEDVRKEARQAAAIGLAVSNLRYYDIPGSLSISFGSGLWRSQSALAFGAGYTSEDGNIRSNVSVTSAGGHWGIGAGITLRLR